MAEPSWMLDGYDCGSLVVGVEDYQMTASLLCMAKAPDEWLIGLVSTLQTAADRCNENITLNLVQHRWRK
ncbi:hypothetical protein SeMB42_g04815 [Synchytrium endobioticum]|uniref:Uncharacterized protein n=1 Tax=Synchytrium endobioticum TaxID=286115 RepID=A0A507CVM7_9FUNG|nr:hypothetical protein SeMB42_g04815 [Synchytrium endobioticum]